MNDKLQEAINALRAAGDEVGARQVEQLRAAQESLVQGFDAGLRNAYGDGRADQADEDQDMLRWAYSKLHHMNFTKLDDALMLDRFKLLLEHGV